MVLVQLSDPHIGATWTGGDAAADWRAAIDAVRRLPDPPDALLVSGDLADHAQDAEYAEVATALAMLDAPAYVLTGNHDDRALLRRHFGLDGEIDAPVHYAVDVGAIRLVALDTTKPGSDGGEMQGMQLEWLDRELAAAPERTTMIAMHHPPFATAIAAFDAIGLDSGHTAALAEIIGRHPQVRRIVAGHVHRAIVAEFAGRGSLSAPSTYVQARLDLRADRVRFGEDPAGFAVHVLHAGELTSHFQPVTQSP